MKVALDTNVLVSAFATRGLCADLLGVVLAEFRLVVGQTVLDELKRVLGEKIRVPAEVIEEVESLIRREAIIGEPTKPLRMKIRDRSDIPVLSEAVAAGAEILVTGDRDLLDVVTTAPIRTMSPREFWEMIREAPAAYTLGPEETTMSKSKDTKRESKKEPKLSLKEKRAAKQAKKAGK